MSRAPAPRSKPYESASQADRCSPFSATFSTRSLYDKPRSISIHFATIESGRCCFEWQMGTENYTRSVDWLRLLHIALMTLIGALFLLALWIPNCMHTGPHGGTSPRTACIGNLREIDNAKEEWALQTKAPASATPTWLNVKPYLGRNGTGTILKCPSGGVYTIGSLSNAPTCSIKGHTLQ